MDKRSEDREFLTTRRAWITPEQAGLRTYGTGSRRVPGLRREEVALLAGVSLDYYTRLERGNANGVSETVLDALARALQLDKTERAHLFDFARAAQTTTPRRRRRGQQRVRPAVQQMLDAMTRPPMQLARNSLDTERWSQRLT
jgi:transcriptional regulator with XRE-family HTH domain